MTEPRRRRRRRQPDAVPEIPRIELEYIDIGDLTPYEFNPRDNEAAIESVRNSILTFGFIIPIVVGSDNVIAAGHTRWAAAQQIEGYTEVPCIRAEHLSDEQLRQFRIIDNKVAELARWDFDLLSSEIQALQTSGLDFTEYGFNREELDCLTDMVADDCLSAEAMTQDDRQQRRTTEARAPTQTRFVLGEFTFFTSAETYRAWASDIRAECDFDEGEIRQRIKDLLRISEFE